MGSDDDEPLSDEELFRRAVEGMDPEEVHRKKYEGRDTTPQDERIDEMVADDASEEAEREEEAVDESPEEPSREARAREEIEWRRIRRQFERAVGPVDENVPRDKYRRRRPPDPDEDIERLRSERGAPAGELITPPLPKSGEGLHHVAPLDAAQRALLERCDERGPRDDLPELYLRGDTAEEALSRLEVFMRRHFEASTLFVRIVHGRGLRSEAEPVLKLAVLGWLEEAGLHFVRGYAPEINKAGDYGSLIVELRRVRD